MTIESTEWTETAKTATDWSENINATATVLVDDLVCLVDDLIVQVDGYDSVKYPSETINNTIWS